MTRPASFVRRVEQTMCDLLGLHRKRSSALLTTADGDPLPVGIAARLGLLRAVASDAAVLTGGMGRGTPEVQGGRRELLLESAANAVSVNLRQPLVLPVRCGRVQHAVRLLPNGSVLPVAHPNVDIDAERVAASLGGQLTPCVREVIAAGKAFPPPSADNGVRSQAIAAGELLSFVSVCRSWMALGYTMGDCAAAVDQGLTHADVQGHLDVGLNLRAAAAWVFLPPEEALRWAALEFTPSDVRTWLSQDRTLVEAERAVQARRGAGRWLARWARVAGPSVGSEALAAWAEMGLPVGVWGDVASRGVRAQDAQLWLAEGFTSVEILRYAHLRIGLAEALTWRAEGFTGFVAAGCLGVGMTLADACALRGLPAREVQDAWKRCRSVEEVRAEVEALVADEQRGRVGAR